MDEHAPDVIQPARIVTTTPWWRMKIPGVALSVVCIVSIFVLAVWLAHYVLDRRFSELNGALSSVEMRLRNLDKQLFETRTMLRYQPQAKALGFQDPDIKAVSIAPSSRFSTRVEIDGQSYRLAFTVAGVLRPHILFNVEHRDHRGNALDKVLIEVPAPFGAPSSTSFDKGHWHASLVRVPSQMGRDGRPIYVAILDELLTGNTVIVAVGPAVPKPAS